MNSFWNLVLGMSKFIDFVAKLSENDVLLIGLRNV